MNKIIKFLNYIKEEKEWASRLDDPYEEENWEDEDNDLPYKFETSIEIGNPVRLPNRKNIYKIVVSNMHGDANAYTKVTVYREKKEDVIKLIDFAEWADELGGYGLEKRMWDVANEVGAYDIIEGDATNDGDTPASPSIEKVTYFDDDGIEHDVKIKQKKIKAEYKGGFGWR
jgi:hypothetical protein